MAAQLIAFRRHGVTAYAGNTTISGYLGHSWAKECGPETVVVDTRTMDDDDAIDLAIRGPIIDTSLDEGEMSPILEGPQPWKDDGKYGAGVRSLNSVSVDVYAKIAGRLGATVRKGALPVDCE